MNNFLSYSVYFYENKINLRLLNFYSIVLTLCLTGVGSWAKQGPRGPQSTPQCCGDTEH